MTNAHYCNGRTKIKILFKMFKLDYTGIFKWESLFPFQDVLQRYIGLEELSRNTNPVIYPLLYDD